MGDQDRQPEVPGRLDDLLYRIRSRPLLYGGIGAACLLAVIVILVRALGGGGGDGAAGDSSTTSTSVIAPSDGASSTSTLASAAAGTSVDHNPLTGESLAASRNDRVIAVKVDNAPEAGPPIGLQDAELIIEAPVEGGATRFTALLFVNEPQVIGPVRSVRPVDADLLAPFEPLLVTTGGQDFVYRELLASGIEIIDETTTGVFQQIERRRPYHLVATMSVVEGMAGGGPPPAPVIPFGDAPLAGDAASSISIPFSGVADVEWSYDDDAGVYTRTVNGAPFEVYAQFDGALAPFTTDTVIVLLAAQRSAGYQDSAGAEVPTFDVIGFGKVLVFHGGEVRTGQWLRSAQADGYVFVDEAGTGFTVPAGRAFVEVVPRTLDVEYR